ncbi:MAG: Gluconeogenesis factor [Microgenomates bacterium OLB23]|nr:MAG: Gluconeogenesis factor [Microgenomates bacterium OLB23]
MKNITVVGGGTGTFVVLSGLKKYDFNLSAVVTSMDSGGSTGKLRDQYGVLPPGDVRQCLVALSEASELWTKTFLYRFEKGDFKGHNFGNIFLTALEQITAPDYQQVIDTASYILQTKGKVIPVTFDRVHLCAEYEDGETLMTEDLIDSAFYKEDRIKKAFLKPAAKPNPNALNAITSADYIIMGPGDMYTSIIPNLLVDGIKDAFVSTNAKIILNMNLMTKRGQTPNYSASDHVIDLEKYLGRAIDVVIINNKKIAHEVEKYYEEYGEQEVENNLKHFDAHAIKVIEADVAADAAFKKSMADVIVRSLQRHDPDKLAKVLLSVIQ